MKHDATNKTTPSRSQTLSSWCAAWPWHHAAAPQAFYSRFAPGRDDEEMRDEDIIGSARDESLATFTTPLIPQGSLQHVHQISLLPREEVAIRLAAKVAIGGGAAIDRLVQPQPQPDTARGEAA